MFFSLILSVGDTEQKKKKCSCGNFGLCKKNKEKKKNEKLENQKIEKS